MAIPQNALDALRKDPSKTPGWSGRLIMFSSTVLFVTLFAFVGLEFGYQPYLESKIQELELDAKKFSQEIPASKREEVIRFYSQLSNVKSLLGSHVLSSQVLALLEAKTLPSVGYTKFALTSATNQLSLGGTAKTVEDISTQLSLFQAEPWITRATVGNVVADNAGAWNFDLVLVFKKGFLQTIEPSSPSSTPE